MSYKQTLSQFVAIFIQFIYIILISIFQVLIKSVAQTPEVFVRNGWRASEHCASCMQSDNTKKREEKSRVKKERKGGAAGGSQRTICSTLYQFTHKYTDSQTSHSDAHLSFLSFLLIFQCCVCNTVSLERQCSSVGHTPAHNQHQASYKVHTNTALN